MQEFVEDFCKTLARMIEIEEEAEKEEKQKGGTKDE